MLVTATEPVNAEELAEACTMPKAELLVLLAPILLSFRVMLLDKTSPGVSDTVTVAALALTSAEASALKVLCKLLTFTLPVVPRVEVGALPPERGVPALVVLPP
jgi:hypothetical protein